MVCQYCEAELTERAMDEGNCPECGASLMGSSLFDDEAIFEEDEEFDEFDEFDEELIEDLDDEEIAMVYDDDEFIMDDEEEEFDDEAVI
jgi:hypothetical protein